MSSDALEDPARIRIRRRIEWMDTDAAGIYHWSTVIRFAEAAEAALHTALGIADRTFGFTPRVAATFQLKRAFAFDDEVVIDFAVEAVGRSSVRYAVTLSDVDGQVAVQASITTCLVDGVRQGAAVPLPDAVRAALCSGGERSAG